MQKKEWMQSRWMHLCVSVALMVLFRLLPPFAGITPYGMAIIGIFAGTIYGWIASDVIWPSFFSLTALVLTVDFAPSASAILATVMSDMTVGFIIAVQFVTAIVSVSGAVEWLGRWFVSRPMIKGRPYFLVLSLLLTSVLVSPLIQFTWLFFMYRFIGVINSNLGYERKSRFAQILLYSVFFSGLISLFLPMQMSLLIPEGIISKYVPGFAFEPIPILLFGSILSVALALANFAAQKIVFRLDLSGLKEERATASIQPPPPMTLRQKIALIIMGAYFLLLLVAAVLPADWVITSLLNKLGLVGLSFIAVVLASVIQVDGKPIASFQEITSQINWSIVFMPGAAIVLASALTGEATGIPATLAGILMSMFSDFSPYLFTVVIVLATMVLTNVINNMVVLSLFVPIVATVAPAIGVNVHAVYPLLVSASYLACMAPSASPQSAILHANTEQMESRQIVKCSLVSMVVSGAVYALVGVPLFSIPY